MIFGKHINRYYLRYAPWLLFGLLSLTLVDWMQLRIPGLYQMVINGVNDGAVTVDGVRVPFDMPFLLTQICRPMLLIALSMVLGRFLWRFCFFGASLRTVADLRSRMFAHAEELSCAYYQKNKVGDLMSLFTNDLVTIDDCFSFGLMMTFDALLLGGMAVYRMWRMDPLMTVLSMIPMALLMAASTLVGRVMTKKWDRRQAAFSRLSDMAQESFSGVAVIKAFVKEAREIMAFRAINDENEQANIAFTRTSVLLRILVSTFVGSVMCVILGYGGYLAWCGTFNAGQLMEFIGYFNAVIWPVMAVGDLIDMTSQGKASLSRIGQLLDAPVDMVDRPDVQPLPPVHGDIELRRLTFRYPDGEFDALRDVSFSVRAGENVGIIGKTGCGKTTLVDLLLRTYNVPDGTVFIDGHDVNTVPIRDVRAAAAYLPQDDFLFSDTIGSNIAFADEDALPERIRAAARMAGVDGDISAFPAGYDTVLGERGVTVSGGQKQRIGIARALLRDAQILILDDPVSAVDTKTERRILTQLRQTRMGRTTIVIAHRISTVEHMDKIVFLEDGAVADVGTHEELCARCPGYRHMVELQRLEEEEADTDA